MGVRLEALLRGPTRWLVQKIFWDAQVIMIEIADVKERCAKGRGHDPVSSKDFNEQRRPRNSQ